MAILIIQFIISKTDSDVLDPTICSFAWFYRRKNESLRSVISRLWFLTNLAFFGILFCVTTKNSLHFHCELR